MSEKTIIDMTEHQGEGFIVPCPSGFCWRFQTGGTYCAHPEPEGIFVPFPWFETWRGDPLYDRWHTKDEGAYTPELIEAWLKHHEIDHLFRPCSGPLPVEEWGEAFVPVFVEEGAESGWDYEQLQPFVGREIILVMNGSD